jgi:hypothetical protein
MRLCNLSVIDCPYRVILLHPFVLLDCPIRDEAVSSPQTSVTSRLRLHITIDLSDTAKISQSPTHRQGSTSKSASPPAAGKSSSQRL